jgi:hypothetical protein
MCGPGGHLLNNNNFPCDAKVHTVGIYLSLSDASVGEVVGPVGYDPTTYRLKGEYSTN